MEKFDENGIEKLNSEGIEKTTRKLEGLQLNICRVIGLTLTLIIFSVLFVTPIDTFQIRALFTGVVLAVGFIITPSSKKHKDHVELIDWLFAFISILIVIYIFIVFRELIYRSGVNPATLDVVFGSLLIVLIIESARRTTGLTLPILSIIFLLYSLFGYSLPGILGHPGYTLERIVSFLFSVQGIYSEPLGVSATYVFMFVLFGTMLQVSGGGDAIMDFAISLTGRFRGGPAKVSIISSALFGTISGSAVSNVVVDGVITIPLMKKTGYPGYYASAVEAVASTGGQITPPVLGAAAFLIAENLGVPYSYLVVATIIPAALYYISLFFMVDFQAARLGIRRIPSSEISSLGTVVKKNGYLLLPIIILMFFLTVFKLTPLRSALWACVSIILLSFVKPKEAITLKKIIKILADHPQNLVTITSTCAAAGIIIGIMNLTGLGNRFALMVVQYSNGNVLAALVLTMIICIILGMGLPPVAAYAVAGTAIGPALIKLGIEPISAHIFIFYFCAISVITPPVALAAYAAAALSGENMWKVGMTAFKIGIAAYIVPYLFVQEPALLLVDFGVYTIYRIFLSLIGVMILAAGVSGWFIKNIKTMYRVILIMGSILMMYPSYISDFIAIGITVFVTIAVKLGFAASPSINKEFNQ